VIEFVDRIRLVEPERRARRIGPVAKAVPDFMVRVFRAAEQDRAGRARIERRHQHEDAVRLGESAQVVKVAVVPVRVWAVAIAHDLGRRAQHRHRAWLHLRQHARAPIRMHGAGWHHGADLAGRSGAFSSSSWPTVPTLTHWP
jgi:hypothetical protein